MLNTLCLSCGGEHAACKWAAALQRECENGPKHQLLYRHSFLLLQILFMLINSVLKGEEDVPFNVRVGPAHGCMCLLLLHHYASRFHCTVSTRANVSLNIFAGLDLSTKAIARETLSIVQFLRLIDRNRIGQSQLVIHSSSVFLTPGAEHSTTWLPVWR